jgi:hypothetical protein
VWVVVLMADEHALAGAPHAVRVIVLLQPPQPRRDGRIFFRLRLLGAESVVA